MLKSSDSIKKEVIQLSILDQLIAAKRYQVVLDKLNQLITETHMPLPAYYHYRAFIYYLLKQPEAALADVANVIKDYPLCFSRTYTLLGLIYRDLKNAPETSLVYFKQALDINDQDPDSYYELAKTYQELHKIDDALSILEKAALCTLNLPAVQLLYHSLVQAKEIQSKTSCSTILQQLNTLPTHTQQNADNRLELDTTIKEQSSPQTIIMVTSKSPIQQVTPINTMAIAWGIDVDHYEPFFDEDEEARLLLTLRNV